MDAKNTVKWFLKKLQRQWSGERTVSPTHSAARAVGCPHTIKGGKAPQPTPQNGL